MKTLTHRFVESFPEVLEQGVLYVSIPYALISHSCCCGCGEEVVVRLSPGDWHMIFDGETITIKPSIGNWGLKCRSHYWITRNRVEWAPTWPHSDVRAARELGSRAKGPPADGAPLDPPGTFTDPKPNAKSKKRKRGIRSLLDGWL